MIDNISILFAPFRINMNGLIKSLELPNQIENEFIKYEKDRYYDFLHEDILNLKDSRIHSKEILLKDRILLGKQNNLEIKKIKISLVIFEIHHYGILFFDYTYLTYESNVFEELSETIQLRYLGKDKKYYKDPNLLCYSNNQEKKFSWLDLFKSEYPTLFEHVDFYTNKLSRIHLLSHFVLNENSNFTELAYNALRITGKSKGQIDDESQISPSIQPRIWSLAMNEGIILIEQAKSAAELKKKYAPIIFQSIFIKLGFMHVAFQLSSIGSELRINSKSGLKNSSNIEKLKDIHRMFLLLKLSSKVPKSHYDEIEHLRLYYIKQFSSNIDFEAFSDSLEDLFEFLQDQRDRESSDRENKIGWILGVLGVTGFVSFIFDYVFVNGNIRLIDYLRGPYTFFPLVSFIFIIAILYQLNQKK